MKLESIVSYVDSYLAVHEHPDYPPAFNGLQVEGPPNILCVAAAVDASLATITEAAQRGADLLLVHHGLFWAGTAPLTGRRFERVRALVDGKLGLYSCHLPLDAHAEVGNCALLARAIGLEPSRRFGEYEGTGIGWEGALDEAVPVSVLVDRVREAVGGGAVHLIEGGPKSVERVGVITGGGASFLHEAARLGLDALVTGEGPHHTHIDAMELGVHVLLGGHYATETFGVRALAAHLAERFEVDWFFIDQPTGL
ncbi:MAG: Nif3-like dinuclear metal center hexameric protein [Gemmatimonadota bacterium]